MTLFDFLWDIPVDAPAIVEIRTDELRYCEQKGFKLNICECVYHNERNYYKCIKADCFDVQALCMKCVPDSLEALGSINARELYLKI